MRPAKYLVLSSLVIFAVNACGDDDSNVVLPIPPDASFDASLIPDGSLGGNGGSGGSSGGAGSGGQPDVADASLDASVDATADAALDSGVDAGPSCTDGVLNGDELGVDCGSACNVACDNVFEADGTTLALFELNGDLSDSSGNGRDATFVQVLPDAGVDAGDPTSRFVDTEWGQGLSFVDTDNAVPDVTPFGFEWNQYANLLGESFTIEMVIVPTASDCYQRLFAFLDQEDDGWYLCDGISSYFGSAQSLALPLADGGPAEVTLNERHYLAFSVYSGPSMDASSTQSLLDVYLDGTLLGTVGASFVAPPDDAIFFEDFSTGEQFDGVVDAVRISSGTRSAAEIQAVWDKLGEQPL
jgi:hypothetical protein